MSTKSNWNFRFDDWAHRRAESENIYESDIINVIGALQYLKQEVDRLIEWREDLERANKEAAIVFDAAFLREKEKRDEKSTK